MSRQSKQNGVKLPFALQKELGIDAGNSRGAGRKHGYRSVSDRKERRKATRVEKRAGQNHQHGRQSAKSLPNEQSDSDFDEDNVIEDVELRGGNKASREPITSEKSRRTSTANIKAQAQSVAQSRPILKSQRPQVTLSGESDSDPDVDRSRSSSPGLVLDASSKAFRDRAAQDDAEITMFEKRLGMRKKDSRKGMGDEMLDYLLEGLDEEDIDRKRKRVGQEWLAGKRRRLESPDTYNEAEDRSDLSNDKSDDESALESELDGNTFNLDILDSTDDDMEDMNDIDAEEADEFSGFDSDQDTTEEMPAQAKARENPYVAPVAPGTAITKYVPPSLRKRDQDDEQSLERLKRQVQGHLNKLSEANVISILGEIEKLYRANARQDLTNVLLGLLLTSFCSRSALPNTFIILHAAFVSAVYKVIGIDFGAEMLSRLVDTFDRQYNSEGTGKEALNLISLLANLFTFGVVSSNIIFDHIRLLLSDFNEANAELLLRIVRDCGPQLRSDDPSALKDIVQLMQTISADMVKNGKAVNVRTRVMMDTITDLKNNKMKAASNAAGVTGEHITRMRKALGSLNGRSLKASEPMRINRADLANSDKRGKWWLVGASWKGNENSAMAGEHDITANGIDDLEMTEENVDFLALAKQYGMNTDIRRSIFVTVMSANDCRDAQMRLLKLRLTNKQEQETAKVLLRCARAEPAYNPYYALLAKNICKDSRKARMSFQFALWDFFSRLGENADDDSDGDDAGKDIEMHEIVNIAKMYAYLIFQTCLTLGVLKALNIGFLKDKATVFMEVLLISIMTQPKVSETKLSTIFNHVVEETPQIVKSLQYFIGNQVRRSDLLTKHEKTKVREGCRVALATLSQNNDFEDI